MSDEFDSMELPDKLQDVASRLRGLRPSGPQASEAECMYRAGWQAALAAHAAPTTLSVANWNKSYLGGLLSGTLVSGALAAALLISMTRPWTEPKAVPHSGSTAQEVVPAASGSLVAQDATIKPADVERPAPSEREAVAVDGRAVDLMSTALLSPVARRQWRQELMRAASPYASPRADSGMTSETTSKILRSSPHDIHSTWF